MSTRTRHRIADADELATDGSRVIEEIDGKEIAVFRIDGELYAVLNYCVHQGGPLCEGQVTSDVTVGEDGWSWEYDKKDRIIACPWHGWKFDIASGANIDDDQYAVPTYPVEAEDDTVYVVFS